MALRLTQGFQRVLHRSFSVTACSLKKDVRTFPDPMEHATGLERKELEAMKAGNMDPFGLKGIARNAGTMEEPNLVPSFEDSRLVGCICEEDDNVINWMWVYKNIPKRCECGHWFKVVPAKPL